MRTDYELYKLLESNGYDTTSENLQILKEQIDNGQILILNENEKFDPNETALIDIVPMTNERRAKGKAASKQMNKELDERLYTSSMEHVIQLKHNIIDAENKGQTQKEELRKLKREYNRYLKAIEKYRGKKHPFFIKQ